jgi:hypothetical protein
VPLLDEGSTAKEGGRVKHGNQPEIPVIIVILMDSGTTTAARALLR